MSRFYTLSVEKKDLNKRLPNLATITLDTASGTLVPAAKNVSPITESGMFKVSPERRKYGKR